MYTGKACRTAMCTQTVPVVGVWVCSLVSSCSSMPSTDPPQLGHTSQIKTLKFGCFHIDLKSSWTDQM